MSRLYIGYCKPFSIFYSTFLIQDLSLLAVYLWVVFMVYSCCRYDVLVENFSSQILRTPEEYITVHTFPNRHLRHDLQDNHQ